MRSSTRIPRPFGRLTLCIVLTAGPVVAAGFENGEVHANSSREIDGITTSAGEVLDMMAVSPPITVPPPPPSFAPAVSTVNGTMNSVELASAGSITGTFNQVGSTGVAQVDFVDNLVVNADGFPAGTDLIVEVTWNVSGLVDYTSSSNITNRSKLLLQADGVNLDPDPQAPPPPKQEWTRDMTNLPGVDEQFDDFGQVTFEYLVQSGTPDFAGNIRMRSVVGFLVGGPGSTFSGNYSANGNAELTVGFVGATNVKLPDGQTLYKWTTNAQSGLSYGSRDDEPPSTPNLTVAPSAGGPELSNLSWDTVATEFYLVQASTDGTTWTTVTEVLGTGNPVSIDVLNPAPAIAYRLIAELGSGNPAASPRPPDMCVTRNAAGDILMAWQTNHWENTALNEIDADGNKTLVQFVQGDGGAAFFDFPPTAPGRIFQVEAVVK